MKKTMRWTLSLLLIICGSRASLAQNTSSGDIRGTVTDPTGAVIPGVTVTAKDVDKNVTTTYVTDGAGLYDTGPIVPDHYLITFTKEGFDTFQRGPITLDVSTQTINGKLKVGATSERVVVTTDVPLLSTEDGSQDATLNSQTMAELPQTNPGADWETFIVLLPGAAGAPENGSNVSNPSQYASINGNMPFFSMLADGATTTLPTSQNAYATIFETTAEVKVSTSAFSAQYGVGDIIYNQITKGGTNQFHGAGYDYFENNALNAAPYEFGQGYQSPPLHFNNFGTAVGGPILKNKMFFYFDFDKTINTSMSASLTSVPTAAVLSGDFTAPGMPTLYDPTTQVIQYTGNHTYTGSAYPDGGFTVACPCVIRKSFAEEYGNGNRIPASMINPIAKNIAAYYPAPNFATTNYSAGFAQNNYSYLSPNIGPVTKFFGRMDYDITPSNRFTTSETESDNPGRSFGPVCPIGCESQDLSNNNAQVSDVWTISPTMTNEARFGFTNSFNFYVPYTIDKGYPAKLGLTQTVADNFPNVGAGPFMGFGSAANAVYKQFVFDPSDVFMLIRGRHVLHFGGEFLINRSDNTNWGNIDAGDLGFGGQYTAAGGANTNAYDGTSFADFLLGEENSWGASNTPEYGGRWKSPQVFVQDDWKVKPNLTVNLGLRYEINTGWSEVHGNMTTFDPTVINPANGQPGAMWYAFSHANGRTTLQAPKYNIVLPRLGFSYQPLPNTVIRGGWGMYASTWSQDTYGGGMGGAFGQHGYANDNTQGICPVLNLSEDGSSPDTTNPGCGLVTNGVNFNSQAARTFYLNSPTTADAENGQGPGYNQYHTPVPINMQWTVSVQRQFGTNYVFELSYVGNHGYNENFPVDINQVPESELAANDYPNSEPYPLFQGIGGSTNNAVSNYNSLQAQATKRMNNGLEFNINYTWSHFLDDLDSSGQAAMGGYQNYQNAYDPKANYSNSNFDIRNMFKGQTIYQLPFGKGRPFLNTNRLLDEIVGGWQTSMVWVIQGGNPMGITTGCSNTSYNQSGCYTQEANLVGNVHLSGSTKSRLNEWYNLAALAVPAPATYGDFRRNTVYGPGVNNWAMSLGKTFDLYPERGIKFQLRADAGNVFNHPSFGQPGNNAIGNGESAIISSVTVGGRAIQMYGRISF